MTTITRISSNYESRLHVEEDTDAVCDCFLVTLCPYVPEPGLLVYSKGVGMNELWKEALAVVAHLRAQPWKAILPPNVFSPMATITARNYIDVAREAELNMCMMLGDGEKLADMAKRYSQADIEQFGEERVKHLCRALDLLNGAPLVETIPWLDFKGLH